MGIGSSYYPPAGPNTVGTAIGQPAALPIFSGEPFSFALAEDWGRRVAVYQNGVRLWYRDYLDSWPRGLDSYGGLLFVANGTWITAYNPLTSTPVNSWNLATAVLGGAIAPITAIKLTPHPSGAYVAVCFADKGAGTVKTYKFDASSYALTFHWSNPHDANNPRGACVADGLLYVADTFGFQVYAVDFSGAKQQWVDVFYPNSIEPAGPNRVRIAAEHENRILLWDRMSGPSGPITVEFSAPVPLFSDPENRCADIMLHQASTASTDPTYTPRKSLCAREYAGIHTLYSPNSAFKVGDALLITDTDNHRVIRVRDGEVVSEGLGFNNPVTAVSI